MHGSSSSSFRAPIRVALAALFACIAIASSTGCSSSKLALRIDSKADANGGAPFYVVLRAVDQAAFVTESYESVAAKAFAAPRDETVITKEVIYPGAQKEVVIERPKDQGVGVYFLFTKPGERWKTARNAPLPEKLSVTLGTDQIESEE